MAGRRRSRSRRAPGPAERVRGWCGRRVAKVRRALCERPWRPTVEADVEGRRGRRLRRAIARVTRDHLAGLGVTPPDHLLVVVQHAVALEERPVESLLQVFEDPEGRRRHVLFLALTAGGREREDEELLATLRQQLQRVAAPQLGTPVEMPSEPAPGRVEPEQAPGVSGAWVGPFERDASPLEAIEGRNGAYAPAAERQG